MDLVLLGAPLDATASFRPGAAAGPAAIRAASYGLEEYGLALDADLRDCPCRDLGDVRWTPPGAPGPVEARLVPPDPPFVAAAAPAPDPAPPVAAAWLETPPDPLPRWADVAAAQPPEAWVGAALDALAGIVLPLVASGGTPVVLGGEHLVTAAAAGAARMIHRELCLLQLDAHADLRDGYEGRRWSHATAMRRALEALGGPARLFGCGIRSADPSEVAFARAARAAGARGYRWLDRAGAAWAGPDAAWAEPGAPDGAPPGPAPAGTASADADLLADVAAALDAARGRPVWLSIDLDVCDPAAAPGTGSPEPGGPSAGALLAAVRAVLRAHRAGAIQVAGADVVEVAPALDPTGRTAVLAAACVRDLVLGLSKTRA